MENEKILKSYDIRPTAIRLMILKCIQQFNGAFSYEDIDEALETVDRSTIFRTLGVFEKSGLIHKFEDGLGHSRYDLIVCDHIHVSCKKCGKTICIPIHSYPRITLPDNFLVEDFNFGITGLCRDCQ